jgi:glycosyltransferase involved in cell wall biosynthesis
MKRPIVISAVNLVEGGPLTILQACLEYLSVNLSDEFEIIALVNDKKRFSYRNITYIEFPESKKSWISRLYYEYYYFGKLAKQFNPFLWLSLHDITPNVTANRLAVYCHNASPFYKLSFKEALVDPKFALFNIFYKFLYRINIKKNDFVIVQQDWLRQRFAKLYGVNRTIVAYPSVNIPEETVVAGARTDRRNNFFYPSFPRFFKNFEVICEAAKILNARGIKDFVVSFTIKGTENRYARSLIRKYAGISQIHFLGLLERKRVEGYYRDADCLIFSSKLETWGLPISEFIHYNKPMLLSDLDFAHETAGGYGKAAFFKPDDPVQLAVLMEDFMKGRLIFLPSGKVNPKPLFAENWDQLFKILLG